MSPNQQIFVVSMAVPRLPLQIEDASRPETEEVGGLHCNAVVQEL